jgi:hypothetical protein
VRLPVSCRPVVPVSAPGKHSCSYVIPRPLFSRAAQPPILHVLSFLIFRKRQKPSEPYNWLKDQWVTMDGKVYRAVQVVQQCRWLRIHYQLCQGRIVMPPPYQGTVLPRFDLHGRRSGGNSIVGLYAGGTRKRPILSANTHQDHTEARSLGKTRASNRWQRGTDRRVAAGHCGEMVKAGEGIHHLKTRDI